mmetsp:Transcript_48010/g.88383  ORF Transcript_48010/g.88383 Transcript_48010/m.88383 type:complete len:397 (+) Transcript_48010:46-1236(+)
MSFLAGAQPIVRGKCNVCGLTRNLGVSEVGRQLKESPPCDRALAGCPGLLEVVYTGPKGLMPDEFADTANFGIRTRRQAAPGAGHGRAEGDGVPATTDEAGGHSAKAFAHDVQNRLHLAGSAMLQEGSNMLQEITEASSHLWGELFGFEQSPAHTPVPKQPPVRPGTLGKERPQGQKKVPSPEGQTTRGPAQFGDRGAESATFTDETGKSTLLSVGATVWRRGQRCVVLRFDPEVHGGLIVQGDNGQEIATSAARVSFEPPRSVRSPPRPSAIKLVDMHGEVKELQVGDAVYRRGQRAIIRRFDREIEPPSLVVEMPDGREVGTEAELVSFSPPAAPDPAEEQEVLPLGEKDVIKTAEEDEKEVITSADEEQGTALLPSHDAETSQTVVAESAERS